MPSARDCADGYLGQARADLIAAGLLQGAAPSAAAILLQMASEKLAKAALLRDGRFDIAKAESTHEAATHMLLQLANSSAACDRLEIAPAIIRKRLAPLVDELERHHPQLAGKRQPNLEYPYQQSATGPVLYPAEHLGVVKRLGAAENDGGFLFRALSRIAERFDQIYL